MAFSPRLLLSLTRSSLPQPILEPGLIVRIGRAADFEVGVNNRFLQEHRICVVRNTGRLYVIYARCTHQSCTPDWVEGERKFKCPCHESGFCMGSAFDGDGINCAGPAPRPLDRAHVELDAGGQVVVNVGRLYQWPKGGRSQFDEPGAFISLKQG